MRTRLAATLVVFLGLAAAPAGAHDLWLIPEDHAALGQKLRVWAHVGMDFPKSEHAPDPAAFKRRFVVHPDGTQSELRPAGTKDKAGLLEFVPAQPGLYTLLVETQPKHITLTADKFSEYLIADGMPHIYRLRAREKQLDKPGSERYSKYVKALVQIGAAGEKKHDRPAGLLLEIVPQRDPHQLKVGEALPVLVLFHGKPLAEANVGWQHPGDGETARGYVRTDAKGSALVPIAQTGLMTLRLTHMTRPRTNEYEWESFWTTLTFRVPSR